MKKFFGVLRYVKGYWRYAILNIVFNILSVIFSLFSILMLLPFLKILFSNDPNALQAIAAKEPVFSFSTSGLLDLLNHTLAKGAVDNGKVSVLIWICLFTVIMVFLKNLFRYLAMYFLAPIRNGVVRDMRNKIFNKSLELPLAYYSEERKGDIMSRMTVDVQEIEWSIMQSLEMIFREPLNIVFFLIMMVFMNPMLTLIAFILLPVSGATIGLIGRSLRRSSAKGKAKMGILLSIMEETLGGLRIIKGFNAEKIISEKFRSENQQYTDISIRMYRKGDMASPLSEFMGVSVLVVILYVGGKMVISDYSMDGEVFITYLALFAQLLAPAKAFTTAYTSVQKGLASAERIDKVLNADVTIKDGPTPKPITKFEKEIEYKNVSFAYREGEVGWVLNDINLKIEKGKTIALVGQSGSGKTTLADMLPRFYDTTQGEILIDGVSIKDAKIADVRALMGIVTQESILFNDTVYNNIAFGIENVTEAQVIEAAKIANAHEFISKMPQGYQTNIGDRGSKMSGGQRQRMSIARAVLKNPPILILDEATSALDTESERLVQDALSNLMKNRTSVVIAHRLSTIQHADEIIVMQKGVIIERGTHTQLLAKNGTYSKLHEMQSFV
ncbi:MAG: ATP-binding cassette domain-containing protein [Bacteroidetes bacterium]|nr:ATP-binding cassette domain-containing protein [Bacteroidota bacterium]